MRLSPAQAAKLWRLSRGESLPRSEVPKTLLEPLCLAQAVRLERSGSSYIVRGLPGRFAAVVEQLWGVRDLQALAEAGPTQRNRTLLAAATGNSKSLPTAPLAGIFIRTFTDCWFHGSPLGLTSNGSALLIPKDELPQLKVGTPLLIGVEGVEAFRKFEKVLPYFPILAKSNFTLVLRWHWRGAWQKWLKEWKGQLLYFPDYDPAGMRIFVTEILPSCPEARLLVPENFETILQKLGNSELYLTQEALLPTKCTHIDVVPLCKLMSSNRKGLEQENLL